MNTALWIVQIVLAVVFLIAGGLNVVRPWEKLAERAAHDNGFSPRIMRLVGLLEVRGALGVVLPAWTGILPWLTPLAAGGLMLTMIGATFENFRNKRFPMIGLNFVLVLLAIFVIYGRFIGNSG